MSIAQWRTMVNSHGASGTRGVERVGGLPRLQHRRADGFFGQSPVAAQQVERGGEHRAAVAGVELREHGGVAGREGGGEVVGENVGGPGRGRGAVAGVGKHLLQPGRRRRSGHREAPLKVRLGRRVRRSGPHPGRAAFVSVPGVILSDVAIQKAIADGRIVIDPLLEGAIQPSSADLRVDRYFRVFRNHTTPFIDPKQPQEDLTELVEVDPDRAFILHPGEFVLGSTLERIALSDDLVARLEGKSSLGRLGLLIHSTAGFVDAGWDGHLTLELSNVATLPIAIYPEMKIGQISFLQMTMAAEHPYGSDGATSKYQGQRGPTPSRYYLNFGRDV